MRGGRNKFGPMYKYDRALRQQALRQRQLLLAHAGAYHDEPGDHRDDMPGGILTRPPCGTPPDVKPDISRLSVVATAAPHERVAGGAPSSPGEFYRRCGGRDAIRVATASVSGAGVSYPIPPPPPAASRLGPVPPYPPPHPPRQYSSSMSSYEAAVNNPPVGAVSYCGALSDASMSRLTPLAGLSNMMNDVPNFVGLQRGVYPPPPPPPVRSSRTSTNLPVYQFRSAPEEVRRPPPASMVQSLSVPPAVGIFSSQPSPSYSRHNPQASSSSSSQLTGTTHDEVNITDF